MPLFSPRSGLSSLAFVFMIAAALTGSAAALIVPMEGWTPQDGDVSRWVDASGACLLHEERHQQAYRAFDDYDKATAFAGKLQKSLLMRGKGQGVQNVAVSAVDRSGVWTVMASYTFSKSGVRYRVAQLYLSDAGKLRTITGSTEAERASPCAAGMLEFIRYMAD